MSSAEPESARAPAAGRAMAQAAGEFLESLTTEQRAVASFPFADVERYEWHYTPIPHNGLQLMHMSEPQRRAALALMASGLSTRGAQQARSIIAHEAVLHEWERLQAAPQHWRRDPEIYYVSVFGAPGGDGPWGWRICGHHLALHFTIVDGDRVSPLPLFFGINPAEVRHGDHKGLRILAAEEDLARALLTGLSPEQKAIAVVDPVAPDDILTKNYRVADPKVPTRGLRLETMSGRPREQLVALIRHYVERSTGDLSRLEWRKIEATGLDSTTFAWAGPEAAGQGHYYAIVGSSFLIEYDNTQNGANHIHSVWRDFTHDFGEDLLAAHYATSEHHNA